MSIEGFLSLIPPRLLFVLNLLLWAGTFYRWIAIDHQRSLSIFPFPIAIPGIAALCFLGLYLIERATDKGDSLVGYLLSYAFLVTGALGVLGF
jgi:hypothetical protein